MSSEQCRRAPRVLLPSQFDLSLVTQEQMGGERRVSRSGDGAPRPRQSGGDLLIGVTSLDTPLGLQLPGLGSQSHAVAGAG